MTVILGTNETMLRTRFNYANRQARMREGVGRFSPYTSHVMGGGGIRMVNADIIGSQLGFTPPSDYHASDRVFNNIWNLTLYFVTGEDE